MKDPYIIYWTLFLLLIIAWLGWRYFSARVFLDREMFALGLGIYCVLPFVVYGLGLYQDGPGSEIWLREFRAAYEQSAILLIGFGLYLISFFTARLFPIVALAPKLNRPISHHVLVASVALVSLIWLVAVYRARTYIGAGYLLEYRSDLMGPLATVNLVGTLLLLNSTQWRAKRLIRFTLATVLVMNSLVLLSMGGRMYVLVALLAPFLQYINTGGKNVGSRLKVVVLLFLLLSVFAVVGLWRFQIEFSLSVLTMTMVAEPLLTSITMGSYFGCGVIEPLQVPVNFAGSIINFLPSWVFPGKHEWLPSLDPSGACIIAPFGATHIVPAIVVNFGWFGGMIFLFLFSYLLAALRRGAKRGWWLHYYVCALLPFMFFRDGFLIFNKALFATGIGIGCLLLMCSWASRALSRVARAS